MINPETLDLPALPSIPLPDRRQSLTKYFYSFPWKPLLRKACKDRFLVGSFREIQSTL